MGITPIYYLSKKQYNKLMKTGRLGLMIGDGYKDNRAVITTFELELIEGSVDRFFILSIPAKKIEKGIEIVVIEE